MKIIITYTMCVEKFLIAQCTMKAIVVSKHESEPQFGRKGYVSLPTYGEEKVNTLKEI